MSEILQKIKDQKIVPLFYNESFEVSKNIVKALYKAGIRVIEYTNRGHQALENFTKLKEISAVEFPELLLGIGTVKIPKNRTILNPRNLLSPSISKPFFVCYRQMI